MIRRYIVFSVATAALLLWFAPPVCAQASVPVGVPVPKSRDESFQGLLNNTTSYAVPHYSTTQPKPNCTVAVNGVVRSSNVVTATVTGCTPNGNPPFVVGWTLRVANMTDTSFNGDFTVSAVTSTTVVWNQTGADATTDGGTVAAILTPGPAQGNYYTDPITGAKVYRFWSRANSPVANEPTHHFYARRSVFNANNTVAALLGGSSDEFLVSASNFPTVSLLCNPSHSMDFVTWDKRDPDKLYFVVNNVLKSQSVSGCSTGTSNGQTTITTFSEYSSIEIGGQEGDLSDSGRYLPVRAVRVSDGKVEWFCYDLHRNEKVSVYLVTGTGATADNNACYDDGTMAIVWVENGRTISSISRTGGIITVTVNPAFTQTPVAGMYVRLFRGQAKSAQAATLNGLWRICDATTSGCSNPTSTTLTLIAPGADVSTISGVVNGWTAAHEHTGILLVNSDGSVNNIFNSTKGHGDSAYLPAPDNRKVWFGHRNETSGTPCSGSGNGVYRTLVDIADWPANGLDDSSVIACALSHSSDFQFQGHTGCDGNWCVTSFTHSGVGVPEASLGASWDGNFNKPYIIEIVLYKTDLSTRYRVFQNRTSWESDYWHAPRCAMSLTPRDGDSPAFILCDSDLRVAADPANYSDQIVVRRTP